MYNERNCKLLFTKDSSARNVSLSPSSSTQYFSSTQLLSLESEGDSFYDWINKTRFDTVEGIRGVGRLGRHAQEERGLCPPSDLTSSVTTR